MNCTEKDMAHLNIPTVLPVDEDYGRFDSEDEDCDAASNSAFTVASSIHNFRIENGRRYHDYKDGHPFPHDEVSDENEIVLHEMCLLLMDNQFYLSPIDEDRLSVGNICDVGMGLGLWAEGMAEKYPDANVVGIDTAPHPRSTNPNCSYMVANAEEEWVLDDPSMKFDLVYIRTMCAGIKEWSDLYQHCFENMKSGGWIEQLEIDIDGHSDHPSDPPHSIVRQTGQMGLELTESSGRDFRITNQIKKNIENAGFVDVQEHRFILPLGHWPTDQKYKDVGRFFERYYKTGLQGWILQICTRQMGWSLEQVNEICIKAFNEINERKHHMYFHLVLVMGQKP